MDCCYERDLQLFLQYHADVGRRPRKVGMDQVEPFSQLFDQPLHDVWSGVEGQFRPIGDPREMEAPWEEEAARVEHRDVIIVVVFTEPVVWHEFAGKEDGRHHDNFVKMGFY